MRTSDLWLILVGLAVLGLTAGALAYLEARDGEVPYRFEEDESPLGESSADVDAGGATLNWTLPANATSAHLELLVSFTGQAFQGGSATVQTQLVGPDGTLGPINRTAFAIPQGSTSGQATLALDLRWMPTPRGADGDPDSFDRTRTWDQPLLLRVVVQEPADLPVAEYAFTARAAGSALAYHHVDAGAEGGGA